MNTTNEYFKQAELAQAAYANLAIGELGDAARAALQDDAGMSTAQAQRFAEMWTVAAQYTDASGSASAELKGAA